MLLRDQLVWSGTSKCRRIGVGVRVQGDRRSFAHARVLDVDFWAIH